MKNAIICVLRNYLRINHIKAAKSKNMSTIIDTLISWLQELWQALFGGADSHDNTASSSQSSSTVQPTQSTRRDPNRRQGSKSVPPNQANRTQPLSTDEPFPWPSTAAHGGKGSLTNEIFTTKEGLLSYCGYKVGASGLPLDPRRRILDVIFLQPLPPIDNAAYAAEWGRPNTAQRLQKLAETIAALTRNAKRRNAARMDKSIREWESDLAYLKRRYYEGRFSFPWPVTDIETL